VIKLFTMVTYAWHNMLVHLLLSLHNKLECFANVSHFQASQMFGGKDGSQQLVLSPILW